MCYLRHTAVPVPSATRTITIELSNITLHHTMAKRSRRQRTGVPPSSARKTSEVNEPAYYQHDPTPRSTRRNHTAMTSTTKQPLPHLVLAIADVTMSIPLLNYICMAFLFCLCKVSDFVLDHYWRTQEKAISEFLSLPVGDLRMSSPFFHLHICIRKSLSREGGAFVMGIDVASRFSVFCIPIKTDANASNLVPLIIKELCQSTIRLNQDCPDKGRPYFITTSDYMIYTGLWQTISCQHSSLLRILESKLSIGKPNDNIPLTSITDALATTLDRNALSLLQGVSKEQLPPPVQETYRSSRTKPGVNRSTVKKEHSVPPLLEFCVFCGTLHLSKMLKECARCQETKYCSKECQKRDWKEGTLRPHKEVCKLSTWKE